jgi:hypothetical protein
MTKEQPRQEIEVGLMGDNLRLDPIPPGRLFGPVSTRRTRSGCCARAASGHAAPAPPRSCHANDPYEEHDFGSFEADGHMIYFKIDLYEEPDVKGSNEEPVVTRVLTIMLAEED